MLIQANYIALILQDSAIALKSVNYIVKIRLLHWINYFVTEDTKNPDYSR